MKIRNLLFFRVFLCVKLCNCFIKESEIKYNISVNSVLEDDLLIEILICVVRILKSSAELVKTFGCLLGMVSAELWSFFAFVNGIDTLHTLEKLRKILWFFVCLCPLIITWIKFRCFLFTFISIWLCWFINIIIAFIFLWLFFNDWFWVELFIFNLVFSDVFKLLFKLKTNNSFNLSKDSFNAENFIHKSEFKLVRFIWKFLWIAKTFKQNELLVSSLCCNSFFQKLHYACKIIVGSWVLCFLECIRNI